MDKCKLKIAWKKKMAGGEDGQANAKKKPVRNDPCWCGFGKKVQDVILSEINTKARS